MKRFRILIILAFGLLLSSCEDVIDVDLDTAAPKLVIEASINWFKNTPGNVQTIKLSTTTGYYSTEFPSVSNAIINVVDGSGNQFDFFEGATLGEYTCSNFLPVIGESYTLTVNLNGETYTASETLVATPTIQDTIVQDDSGGFAGDQIEVRFFFQDDGTQENYYMSSVNADYLAFPNYSVSKDQLFQGNVMFDIYSSEDLKSGDVLDLRLFGISRRYYDYFNKLLGIAGGNGGPFETAPVTVRGNIVNLTNVNNYALGYFRLSEADVRSYTVE